MWRIEGSEDVKGSCVRTDFKYHQLRNSSREVPYRIRAESCQLNCAHMYASFQRIECMPVTHRVSSEPSEYL